MSKEQIARRIIVNDDGWIVSFSNKRIDKNTLETEMLCRYSGSPVDTISWCVGDHEVYDYETQIGEIFGVGQEVTNDEKITIGELTSDHEQALKNFDALKKFAMAMYPNAVTVKSMFCVKKQKGFTGV